MKSSDIHIYQTPDKVLKTICSPISPSEINNDSTRKIVMEMKQALAESGDGVAIAAPQIGHTVRIFVVAGSILDHVNNYHGDRKSVV